MSGELHASSWERRLLGAAGKRRTMVWVMGSLAGRPTTPTALGRHSSLKSWSTVCLPGPDCRGDHLHSFLLVLLLVAGDLPGGAGGRGPGPYVLPEGKCKCPPAPCPVGMPPPLEVTAWSRVNRNGGARAVTHRVVLSPGPQQSSHIQVLLRIPLPAILCPICGC